MVLKYWSLKRCVHFDVSSVMGDLYEPLQRQAMLARLKVRYQNKPDSPSAWWNRNRPSKTSSSYTVHPPPLTGPSSVPSKAYLRAAQAVDDPRSVMS